MISSLIYDILWAGIIVYASVSAKRLRQGDINWADCRRRVWYACMLHFSRLFQLPPSPLRRSIRRGLPWRYFEILIQMEKFYRSRLNAAITPLPRPYIDITFIARAHARTHTSLPLAIISAILLPLKQCQGSSILYCAQFLIRCLRVCRHKRRIIKARCNSALIADWLLHDAWVSYFPPVSHEVDRWQEDGLASCIYLCSLVASSQYHTVNVSTLIHTIRYASSAANASISLTR